MGARYHSGIRATIDGIQDIKRGIGQYRDRINKQYKFLMSRVRKFTTATNELTKRIKESDIFSRAISRTTREFEEVARRYVLGRIPEDTKIDVNKIKRREIKDIGIGGDMGMG